MRFKIYKIEMKIKLNKLINYQNIVKNYYGKLKIFSKIKMKMNLLRLNIKKINKNN